MPDVKSVVITEKLWIAEQFKNWRWTNRIHSKAAEQINGREGETATFFSRCLVSLKLRVIGFAPRHLSRWVRQPAALKIKRRVVNIWRMCYARKRPHNRRWSGSLPSVTAIAGWRARLSLGASNCIPNISIDRIARARPIISTVG